MLLFHENEFFTFHAGIVIDGKVVARRITLSVTHNMDVRALEATRALFKMQTVESKVYHIEGPVSGDMPAPKDGYCRYTNMTVHQSHIELLDQNDCYLCAIADYFNDLIPGGTAVVRARLNPIEIRQKGYVTEKYAFTAALSDRLQACAVYVLVDSRDYGECVAAHILEDVSALVSSYENNTFNSPHFKSSRNAEIDFVKACVPVVELLDVQYFIALGETVYEIVPEAPKVVAG